MIPLLTATCPRHETNETKKVGRRNFPDAPSSRLRSYSNVMGASGEKVRIPKFSVLPHIAFARRSPLRAPACYPRWASLDPRYALGLTAAIGLGAMVSATMARPTQPPLDVAAEHRPFDPSPFILKRPARPALDDGRRRCAGSIPGRGCAGGPGTVGAREWASASPRRAWCPRFRSSSSGGRTSAPVRLQIRRFSDGGQA